MGGWGGAGSDSNTNGRAASHTVLNFAPSSAVRRTKMWRPLPSRRQLSCFIAGGSLPRWARRLGHAGETEEVPDPAHVVGQAPQRQHCRGWQSNAGFASVLPGLGAARQQSAVMQPELQRPLARTCGHPQHEPRQPGGVVQPLQNCGSKTSGHSRDSMQVRRHGAAAGAVHHQHSSSRTHPPAAAQQMALQYIAAAS